MFKKLLFTLAFLAMTIPAFAIQVGNIDANIENMMCVVYDSGELSAAVTDLTVSGLDGDTDETYEIITRIIGSDSISDSNFGIRLNGDGTDGNYGYQVMRGICGDASAVRSTYSSMLAGALTATGNISFCHAIINTTQDLSKTGIMTYANNITETSVNRIVKTGNVWNNNDNVTSINFHASEANAYGIGSRIIILKKVADDDTGMRVGNLSVSGSVIGAWELVTEEDVEADCTDLTISGLSGDTDVLYKLSMNLSNSNSSASDYFVCPNGDQTNGNYGWQRLTGSDSTVYAARGDLAGLRMTASGTDKDFRLMGSVLLYAKSGYERTAIIEVVNDVRGTIVGEVNLIGGSWNNTTDAVTSINLNASQSGGIGKWSKIKLWKLNLE